MASKEDELDDLKRAYDSAAGKVGKSGYLAGNGGEKLLATTFHKYAQFNNNMGDDRPHKMILKKKYRRG